MVCSLLQGAVLCRCFFLFFKKIKVQLLLVNLWSQMLEGLGSPCCPRLGCAPTRRVLRCTLTLSWRRACRTGASVTRLAVLHSCLVWCLDKALLLSWSWLYTVLSAAVPQVFLLGYKMDSLSYWKGRRRRAFRSGLCALEISILREDCNWQLRLLAFA